MNHSPLDDRTITAALTLAVRAPSVRNSQPWRFRTGPRGLDLFLDPIRALDIDRRDLVLSCGAMLHHLRVVFASMGWSAVVRRLPDPVNPDHLASLELIRLRPTMTDTALAAAINRRHTDRRHFGSDPVPPGYLSLVTERAAAAGGVVRQAASRAREQLVELMNAAATTRAAEPALPVVVPPESDCAELLVIGTAGDDMRSRLCAGEAMSAVLLTATNVGLASCVLTAPFALPESRKKIRADVLDDAADPQAIIRIGVPRADAPPLLPTPRLPIEQVLDPFSGDGSATAC